MLDQNKPSPPSEWALRAEIAKGRRMEYTFYPFQNKLQIHGWHLQSVVLLKNQNLVCHEMV